MIDPENPESIEDMEFSAYREKVKKLNDSEAQESLATKLKNFDHFPELEDPGDFKADNEAKEEKEGIEDL